MFDPFRPCVKSECRCGSFMSVHNHIVSEVCGVRHLLQVVPNSLTHADSRPPFACLTSTVLEEVCGVVEAKKLSILGSGDVAQALGRVSLDMGGR